MSVGDLIIASPILIGLIVIFWYCFPRAIYLFSPKLIRSYFKENTTSKITERQDVQQIMNKLKAMNFRYLGIKVEKPPLWNPSIEEISLSSNEEHSFATIYVSRKKAKMYFLTPFSSGQVVLTASSSFAPINKESIIQSSLTFKEPKDLLEAHKKMVASFTQRNLKPADDYTKQTRIDATNLYYRCNIIRNQLRVVGILYVIFILVPLVLFILTITK